MRCSPTSLLIPLAALLGCGGAPNGLPPASPPSYPNLTGNWNLILVPSNPLVLGPDAGGFITNTNGSVTGILHITDTNCYTAAQDIPVTGTVTSAGILALNSAMVAGQMLSITGIAFVGNGSSATLANLSLIDGNYTFTGGCLNGESGLVVGEMVPPVTGNYAGTLQSASGQSFSVNASTTQEGPNADGEYNISGSVTFTGSPCFSAGTITSSTIFGANIEVTITATNGTMELSGQILPTVPMSIIGSYQVNGGACAGDTGSGTLTGS